MLITFVDIEFITTATIVSLIRILILILIQQVRDKRLLKDVEPDKGLLKCDPERFRQASGSAHQRAEV